ncbi:hypothetical protein BGZ94_008435 [Podila epigama]|nr:hypothetical protein BGZ94_008435 [Podila epigama]
MASTVSRRQPTQFQFRIIQQEFDNHHKRRIPDTTLPSRDSERNNAMEEDNDSQGDDNDGDGSQSSTRVRKKPGRKPNPASPAIRKEQNRAAQRAFRDRKERHLQQLEKMIKDLKDAHSQATARSQREAHQLRSTIESLQSENFYLREVVFSFESALSKNGNVQILQDVKAELYRRHYEKHSAKKQLSTIIPSHETSLIRPTTVDTTPSSSMFATPATQPPPPVVAKTRDEILTQAIAAATAAITSDNRAARQTTSPSPLCSPLPSQAASSPPVTAIPVPPTTPPSQNHSQPHHPVSTSGTVPMQQQPTNSWSTFRVKETEDDPMFMGDSDILYRAPPLFTTVDEDSGKLRQPMSSSQPLSVPRPSYQRPGTLLSKHTEYTKHPSVFDELQSSLFPPGTLQSLVHGNIPTPQEIVNEVSLFDQLQDRPMKDPVISSGTPNVLTMSSSTMLSSSFDADSNSFLDSEEGDDFDMSTPILGFDDGLKQEIFPSHRLQLEIRVLASAPPVADPNIDPKIYELPHDSRIDLIPCPKLRAQMILHQGDYDIEELCDLLIESAICHGHPLDPHSWELPEAFFDRFGYLLGQEMMRHRNKIWPKKEEEELQYDMSRVH